MRVSLAMLSLPLLSLAACGGGGVNTIGSIAPPASSDPVPGQTFLDVSTETTFNAVAAVQSLAVDPESKAQTYAGDAGTTSSPGGTVTYDPRDGIFTLVLNDDAAAVSQNVRYQDPFHRTDDQALEVPDYADYNYLTAGSVNGTTETADTFFYQRPGKTTSYVTLAGFVHTDRDTDKDVLTNIQRGAMVFGTETPLLQAPTSGSGHYDGAFLASMIDGAGFAWLNGSSAIEVDFAKSTVGVSLAGVVGTTFANGQAVTGSALDGATFNATAAAALDSAGDFSGHFSSAFFTAGGAKLPVDFTAVNPTTNVAGGSSIDGRFYGPGAKEIGGNFRIVGGVPGERVDILGAFTGAKK